MKIEKCEVIKRLRQVCYETVDNFFNLERVVAGAFYENGAVKWMYKQKS